ncbi:Vacuolar protein sorting-associated protein 24-like protein 1 [Hibiscus syriacus]|uniref:Vacuolar protein sorting-associated protein 24-like protein 1 n=1 Tax=Hibiscus syriacus TaxID=106335 RepID=A0A6A3B7C8_HIBSY|nr:Vacuolar protein sorting-associated protein 24-like protein 1 [Hibiscus syriacus]
MEKVMNIIKPKPNPQQLLRDWQRRLRQECHIQREEKNVQKAIRDAAKRNDMGSAKALSMEIVRSRRTVNRLYGNKAQLNSISMHLGESVAISRTVGHLSKSAEVMKLVNNLMKAPEVAVTMQEFSKEMTKAGVIEEFVNDALDNALDSEDIEEETEEEVDKVLTAIAGETAAQLPEAVRKEKMKQPVQAAAQEEEAIAEGVDDEEELEEIRARLAKGIMCKKQETNDSKFIINSNKVYQSTNDLTAENSKIAERQFRFPLLGAPAPFDKFAHHAGYYNLPHSKSARVLNRGRGHIFGYFGFTVIAAVAGAIAVVAGAITAVESNSDSGADEIAVSNILFIDQPIGTGFSYTSDDTDIRHDENGVSNDLYDFLQAFFKEHPQREIKAKEGIHINLKGFAIGNGLTNPGIQYQAYPDYALNSSLISQSDYVNIKKSVPSCMEAIKSCDHGGLLYYDIRKQCDGGLCYYFSGVDTFLNLKSVREALWVGDIDFMSCSSVVYEAMNMDWIRNFEVGIPSLLEDGIKWVHAMTWSGQKYFGASPTVPFILDGVEAGKLKRHGPLTFLKVHEAGHMVPMDQPKASYKCCRNGCMGK